MQNMPRKTVCIFIFGLVLSVSVFSQDENFLQRGLKLYGVGDFAGALNEFRTIDPSNTVYNEALYWIILAELGMGNYEEALLNLETLEERDPLNRHGTELPYHKGRILYYLGRYNQALILLSDYAEIEPDKMRKAAALYWAGESLLALGEFDRAENAFALVLKEYPDSAKYEAASYRLEIIKQKKIEAELLVLIKWLHEESLKNEEEYARRERAYNQAISAYQKQLAELRGNPYADIQEGEAFAVPAPVSDDDKDRLIRLLLLKADTLYLQNLITENMGRTDRK